MNNLKTIFFIFFILLSGCKSTEGIDASTNKKTLNTPAQERPKAVVKEKTKQIKITHQYENKQKPSKSKKTDHGFIISINKNDSLKKILKKQTEKTDYQLVWATEKDLFFNNTTKYNSPTFEGILYQLSKDISEMGIDINFKIYKKNNVILVYSVR